MDEGTGPSSAAGPPLPSVPFALQDLVAVVEFHRAKPGGKGGSSSSSSSSTKGQKVHSGVARIVGVDTAAGCCDVHFYLDGRRAKAVPWEHLRHAGDTGAAPASGGTGAGNIGAAGGTSEDAGVDASEADRVGHGHGCGEASSSSSSSSSSCASVDGQHAEALALLAGGAKRDRKKTVSL